MKIAIIGGGISGLTAAYRLCLQHNITLFEANDYLGGHTNTVDVELDGRHYAIDTGFIVFNDWTYPRFMELLDELGVQSRPTTMSFSVRCEAADLEYNGSSLNGLFAQRRNLWRPSFYRMLADIVRFNRQASEQVLQGCDHDETTVGEYLARHDYSREFAEHYLLPMGAAIWSCPLGAFMNFPIGFIVQFYKNHGLLSVRHRPTWRVIDGGSRTYVGRMASRFADRVRLGWSIQQIRRTEDGVEVTPANRPPERFDHVILACHSDQALGMLSDPTRTEREVLSEFPYSRNVALLHTDRRVLPKRRRAWASWNYHFSGQPSDAIAQSASVTYCMNILQHIRSSHTFNVTLNSHELIEAAKVLRQIEYHHPVFTVRRAIAQSRHQELLVANRTSYCGAYWGNGFHEDGVVSALRVCEAITASSRLHSNHLGSLQSRQASGAALVGRRHNRPSDSRLTHTAKLRRKSSRP
ncbi:MAG: FAD-dependent oxidoreductase [Pirellulaceae bacterium]|nr:FAD-dependent oxidoreductase [Pirellulaceae bacterium]